MSNHSGRPSLRDVEALSRENSANLLKLRHHWGSAFDIGCEYPDGWSAARLDGKRTLTARSAAELRALIIADYSAEPVPRGDGDD